MEDLIKALQILMKYRNDKYPTHCEHDVMLISGITKDEVSTDDIKELDELGFFYSDEYESFISFKFGSC